MDWIQSMQKAIDYMEANLLEEIDQEQIARCVYCSEAHLRRVFSIISGMTISDYIRCRRLSLAGQELARAKARVTDVAFRYGYDTVESFTKAFFRFHGVTPSAARKSGRDLKVFDPLSIQITIQGGFRMARKLIHNVPLITMSADDYSYLTSFVGALYGALKGLGDEFTNAELLAISGMGNRLCWTEGKWIFGNEDVENCNNEPFEMQGRLVNAIGWKMKRVAIARGGLKDPQNTTAGAIRQDFVRSIDKGIPVLAQGITDDGCKHDYDVFYGYEDDGVTLIGWDYYQQGDQPFVRQHWERELNSYILLTEKGEPAQERSRVLAALQAIAAHARQGEVRGRKVGIAAWEALLNQLEHDDFDHCTLYPSEQLPDDDAGVHSLQHRFIIYCDALTQISQRGAILPYYQTLLGKFPEWAPELAAAMAAWRQCADYGGFLWSQGLSFDDAGFEKFRGVPLRKRLADEGRRAMQRDIEAIEQIERILDKV